MSHMVRDFSIWNMLVYGSARTPNGNDPEQDLDNGVSSSPTTPSSQSTDTEDYEEEEEEEDEKQRLMKKYQDEETIDFNDESKGRAQTEEEVAAEAAKQQERIARTKRMRISLVIAFLYLLFVITHPNAFGFSRSAMRVSKPGVEVQRAFFDEGYVGTESSEPHEIISVTLPLVGEKSFGEPVYSTLAINHTFGASWGKPAVVNFTPPVDTDYNKVVLTLNTTVDGVQYDRLAHLFVDGIQIWRTSTIEPGGRSVISVAKKDVTTYLKLFQKPSTLVFQLDNVLSSRLTGKFHIELTVDFYKVSEKKHHNIEAIEANDLLGAEDIKEEYSLFSVVRPADTIYPITLGKSNEDSPLQYLPSDKIHVKLPTVPVNTTRLILTVFTSGNAAEEFWYTNVLDTYKDKFANHGRLFNGHGPVRIVNILFNGEKIAVQTAQPVVFTGGISPALWSSVVGVDAFDVKPIHVDVSGLLPYLWESQAIKDKFLEIEISNGLGELGKAPSTIVGENWITTANLLAFENADVVAASGEVLDISHDNKGNTIAIAPPFTGAISQIINNIFTSQIISKFALTLKSGRVLHTTISSYTKGEVSNVQSYGHYGEKQSVVHVGHSVKYLLIQDDDLPIESKDKSLKKKNIPANTIHALNASISYPLVLSVTEQNKTLIPGQEFEIEYDVTIANVKDLEFIVNGEDHIKISNAQNGTSKYFLSSKGNHGYGKLETRLKAKAKTPTKKFKYSRLVKAENGTITTDRVKSNSSDIALHKKAHKTSDLSVKVNKYDKFFSKIMNISGPNNKFCAQSISKLEEALTSLKEVITFELFSDIRNIEARLKYMSENGEVTEPQEQEVTECNEEKHKKHKQFFKSKHGDKKKHYRGNFKQGHRQMDELESSLKKSHDSRRRAYHWFLKFNKFLVKFTAGV
ncbi:peptide N-acetyl-beta-D-glucosaminyl asparaginase amidase A-domain-containing protein [Scheffersomyces amazonensis]|uniref:peptide N-acetyl-beta-D-glucosaminyl asparaginase amidase A-domain-containing protein n=1 Tax=Scheffersomyces amazonensis TaxID=1078765 RepID=UPI00315CB247